MLSRLRLAVPFILAAACISLPAGVNRAGEMWAFTVPGNDSSVLAAESHADLLHRIVSGWIVLDSASFRPVSPFNPAGAPKSQAKLAVVTTLQGERYHPSTIRGLAGDSGALGRTASAVARMAAGAGYTGLVIDFAGMTRRDLDALMTVTGAIADSARAVGLAPIAFAVPAADTAVYPGQLLRGAADVLLALFLDEHSPATSPGPIASPDWMRRLLGARVAEVGANRVVAVFPAHGYRWTPNAPAELVSYPEAESLARQAGLQLARDPVSGNLRANLPDGGTVWVSDRELLLRLTRDARRVGVTRIGLWRIGLEDPSIWNPPVRR